MHEREASLNLAQPAQGSQCFRSTRDLCPQPLHDTMPPTTARPKPCPDKSFEDDQLNILLHVVSSGASLGHVMPARARVTPSDRARPRDSHEPELPACRVAARGAGTDDLNMTVYSANCV